MKKEPQEEPKPKRLEEYSISDGMHNSSIIEQELNLELIDNNNPLNRSKTSETKKNKPTTKKDENLKKPKKNILVKKKVDISPEEENLATDEALLKEEDKQEEPVNKKVEKDTKILSKTRPG